MKVLVTGGAGFIGSHTCLELLQRGFEVVVIDSYVNSHQRSLLQVNEILKLNNKVENINIDTLIGDIRDEKVLDTLFLEYEKKGNPIQAVIHFAGLKSVSESTIRPLHYWDVNVNGSINLLRVMNKYNCRTIVFSSSATVYKISNNKPLDENSKIKPNTPYGRTKSAVEQLMNDVFYSQPDKWRIANLRYFNPIGAHHSGLIGEDPLGIPNNIFPMITQVTSGHLEQLTVFGNDWPTQDGTGVRDYIHVMDLAEGHISTLRYLIDSKSQVINLNLGTGIGTSVLELINKFEKVNNLKINMKFAPRRIGDNASVIADNSLATSLLNWFPKRDIEQMCIDGWKWKCLNPNGYK